MRGNPTVDFTCDRCGLSQTTASTDRPMGWRYLTHPQLVERDLNAVTKYDLCTACDEAFDEWWRKVVVDGVVA